MTAREKELRKTEQEIPRLAKSAVRKAYAKSLESGNTVMVRRGGRIVAVSPDGRVRAVKKAPPRVGVGRGKRYSLH